MMSHADLELNSFQLKVEFLLRIPPERHTGYHAEPHIQTKAISHTGSTSSRKRFDPSSMRSTGRVGSGQHHDLELKTVRLEVNPSWPRSAGDLGLNRLQLEVDIILRSHIDLELKPFRLEVDPSLLLTSSWKHFSSRSIPHCPEQQQTSS
ncbi:hypothetical protein PGT21_001882 [Puccinia graminis f. sp. tritici]|uniref:Uncharacterized protein n=1 Tax=Puccinia graminis f. sp. tritici TaxID=56615 RepID=A0A5B0QZF5_PUCGR|nr:hypothetical protein PGT21_001882 [Puccinia graminis f. sp. tritici]